jgi:hypothetical protein
MTSLSRMFAARFWPQIRLGLFLVGAVVVYATQEIWLVPFLLFAGLFNLWLWISGKETPNWRELVPGALFYAGLFLLFVLWIAPQWILGMLAALAMWSAVGYLMYKGSRHAH